MVKLEPPRLQTEFERQTCPAVAFTLQRVEQALAAPGHDGGAVRQGWPNAENPRLGVGADAPLLPVPDRCDQCLVEPG